MELHLNPELESKQLREMLDRRYEDLKTGRVAAVTAEEVVARLRGKSDARRAGC